MAWRPLDWVNQRQPWRHHGDPSAVVTAGVTAVVSAMETKAQADCHRSKPWPRIIVGIVVVSRVCLVGGAGVP